jgi:hypothetical protein
VVIAVLPAVVVTALLVDCDGVLADTERYGHLPAFNLMFDELGVPAHWSEDEYAEKLKIGGGKERMASMFRDPDFIREAGIPDDEVARKDLLARWHKSKTAHVKQLVAAGAIPPRSGIHRIVNAALDAGWTVAVCSTSAEESVRAVFERAVGKEAADKCALFCGDIVPAQEAGAGHLPARRREAGPRQVRQRWSSRTHGTACSRRSRPACPAWSPSTVTPVTRT